MRIGTLRCLPSLINRLYSPAIVPVDSSAQNKAVLAQARDLSAIDWLTAPDTEEDTLEGSS